jgi:hypothetical protein
MSSRICSVNEASQAMAFAQFKKKHHRQQFNHLYGKLKKNSITGNIGGEQGNS